MAGEQFLGGDITGDGINDVDITNAGDYTVVNGVTFTDAVRVGSGTGGYNTFLAISNNSGVESGFNSDDTPPIDNTNKDIDQAKTHTVLLSSLVVTTINGVDYYQIRIDLNESNSDPNAQLSLDQFKLYTSSSGTIESTTTLFSTGTLKYDMDAGGNKSILLSDAGSTGSGTDDYSILIPTSLFAGQDPTTTYLYVYTQLGAAGTDWTATSTFEEFNLENGVALTGVKFNDLNSNGVRDAGEAGVQGVTIYIDANKNGQYDSGERTTTTDANGNYTFYGVPLNQTVWIDEVTPAGATQTTGDHETVVISSNATGTIVVDPIGNHYPVPSISIDKTAAFHDGSDCADTLGELIDYTVTVTNDGEVALENVVVKDSFEGGSQVTITGPASGDTNSNGQLDVGETWTYTYTHAVTQADIDSNGGDGDGTLDNVATVTSDPVGSSTTNVTDSDDASADVCQNPGLSIDKTAVLHDGGDCADEVGDVIDYTVTVTNTGNVALENVVVTDSFEGGSDVTITGPDSGDTNSNGKLDVGETWTYTYSHTVTQDDLDGNGGGDGTLDNVATANADAVTSGEAAPEVSDDASADVCQFPTLAIDKTAVLDDGGDCADEDGDIVNYTVTVTNIGNVTLENVVVTDSFEGGSDVTITGPDSGDANSNGKLDVGETWTYTYSHTVTQAEIDSNGVDDDGTLDNVATANATAVTSGTAADAVSDDASVDVCQFPTLTIDKEAVLRDGGDCADQVGDFVDYTVTVTNTGNVAVENVVVTDSFEGGTDVTITGPDSGDTNLNGQLDVGETWTYTYSHEVTQDDLDSNGGDNDGTLDNVATVNGDAVGTGTAAPEVSDDASADVCQFPTLAIDKTAVLRDGGDCADAAGDVIDYTVTVSNAGNVTLENVVLTDSFEGGSDVTITGPDSGDTNSNGKLDVGETWTYTYSHTVTQDEMDSNGGGDGTLDNVATANADAVTSGVAADAVSDDASADVCQFPGIHLEKDATVPGGTADTAGELISYTLDVTNTGNISLTGITITDPYADAGSIQPVLSGGFNTGDADMDGALDLTETWHYTATHTVTQEELLSNGGGDGMLENTATVTSDQGVSDDDDASVPVVPPELGPCPRTPGFWQNMKNGGSFWDGIAGNEKHAGEHDFPDGELLYAVDSNNDGTAGGAGDVAGLLIGDWNKDGLTNNGEDTLFISYDDARKLINANNKQLNSLTGDGKFMLGRDMVAAWLNYEMGSGFGDASDPNSPTSYLQDAINYMQIYGGNNTGGGGLNETFDQFVLSGPIKTSTPLWKQVQAGVDHSGSQLHAALDYYNNTGMTSPGGTVYAMCDDELTTTTTTLTTAHTTMAVFTPKTVSASSSMPAASALGLHHLELSEAHAGFGIAMLQTDHLPSLLY